MDIPTSGTAGAGVAMKETFLYSKGDWFTAYFEREIPPTHFGRNAKLPRLDHLGESRSVSDVARHVMSSSSESLHPATEELQLKYSMLEC